MEATPRFPETDVEHVVSCLSSRKPTTEKQLREFLAKHEGWDADRVNRACNEAQAQNLIRWVAFEGWMLGGRPE